MLVAFKNLTKEQQYQIITEYMKKIEKQCILLKEIENKKLLNSIPLLIDTTVNLIFISKLSENFKKLLIEEINEKIKIFKKNKTR